MFYPLDLLQNYAKTLLSISQRLWGFMSKQNHKWKTHNVPYHLNNNIWLAVKRC